MAHRRSILAGISLSIVAGAIPGMAGAAPGSATAGRAGIHPWARAGDKVAADVIVDGTAVARLDYRIKGDGLPRRPALVFGMPVGMKRIRIKGEAMLQGKAVPLDRTWTVRDIASLSAPLYDQSKPWIERVRGLEKSLDSAVTVIAGDGGAKKKPAKAAFADLEKQLGAPLPPLVKVLGDWTISVNDSYFLSAAAMRTVTELMLSPEWGYERKGPDGIDEILPTAVRARYDRSLAVYVHMGDGMGALAWDPAGVTPGEPPNSWESDSHSETRPAAKPGVQGAGVWYWLHQDGIDQPELLLDDDYRPKTTEAALTNVFQRFALSHEASADNDNEVVIDSANPRPNLLQLHFEDGKRPRLWMRSYDYQFSKY